MQSPSSHGAAAAQRIVLIDPHADLGAGIAYATRDCPYPLNVAARQMSVDSAQPRDFLEYTRATGIHAALGDYLPRQVCGEYRRARFAAARAWEATAVPELREHAAALARRLIAAAAADMRQSR